MKKLLLFFLTVLTLSALRAQQDPQFTQNMFNKLAVNPAYAGSNNAICGTLISRQQWLGFEGRPQTNLFSIESNLHNFNTIALETGIGLTVIQDQIGPLESFNAKLALSFSRTINQGRFSIGIEPGVFSQSINGDWVTTGGPNGNGDGSEDVAIPNGEASDLGFDLGVGLYYQTNELYVGLSSTHINQSELTDQLSDNSGYLFQLARHYYLMAGYDYQLPTSGADVVLQPSVFVKSDVVSTQMDLNMNVLYNNLFWGGVSYRVEDAVAALAGVNVPQLPGLRVGLSYDFNISALSDYNDGSLEVMLKYCYAIVKQQKIQRYVDPRFM